jgi:uncharacterized membrane protein
MADSPVQDPTTAVQAIDRIHDILRQLAPRPLPDGRHRDSSGTVRLEVPAMTWEAYVHLAFDELRLAGAGSPQVSRRLMEALHDLRGWAPRERRLAIEEQIDLLRAAVRSSADGPAEAAYSLVEDREGIGVAAGR